MAARRKLVASRIVQAARKYQIVRPGTGLILLRELALLLSRLCHERRQFGIRQRRVVLLRR
jgi:hypothetical protein